MQEETITIRRRLLEAADAIAAAIRSGLSLSLLSARQAMRAEEPWSDQLMSSDYGVGIRRTGLVLFTNGAYWKWQGGLASLVDLLADHLIEGGPV
jgi:hypothetical protein